MRFHILVLWLVCLYYDRAFWNFEIPSNVTILERSLSRVPQPHPEIEIVRGQCVEKLRQQYTDLCMAREGYM